MLKYPLAVFLDSNIFISAKYDFSDKGIFNTLLGFVATGKIKLYVSSVVKGEVKRHINEEISKLHNCFKQARSGVFKTVSENYLTQWCYSHLFIKPDKTQMLSEMNSAFEKFLQDANAVELDCSNIDCNQIILDYFTFKPPFADNDKKRKEFPDAIMAAKIKNVFNNNNNPVFVVSDDAKFREALDGHIGVTTFEILKEVFDLINKEQAKTYNDVVQFISESNAYTALCQEIYFALDNRNLNIDGTDCDRKGTHHGFDYEEVCIDSIKDVAFKFMSVDEITSNKVSVTVTATALISATCTFFDEANSVWDSEEKEYIYSEWVNVSEVHKPNFECEIVFDINNDGGDGITLELDTINFDLSLDEETRISREIIPSSNPAEDAYAEQMDTLEEYYNL